MSILCGSLLWCFSFFLSFEQRAAVKQNIFPWDEKKVLLIFNSKAQHRCTYFFSLKYGPHYANDHTKHLCELTQWVEEEHRQMLAQPHCSRVE